MTGMTGTDELAPAFQVLTGLRVPDGLARPPLKPAISIKQRNDDLYEGFNQKHDPIHAQSLACMLL